MLKLPVQHHAFLTEYTRHLFLAVSATRNFIHQQKILDMARTFIGELPLTARSKVIGGAVELLGNSRIARYVSALTEK
jgi:hypothetical protein